ncbi:hypothetical protein NEOC65_001538 [Neochlamydia sp. AcF65]|nr:hypothetical protein [Neochlamydia sp. AcF65]NGY95666.1 hypothetical protein [Neochlamydia sp. AcF84]
MRGKTKVNELAYSLGDDLKGFSLLSHPIISVSKLIYPPLGARSTFDNPIAERRNIILYRLSSILYILSL